MDATAAHGELTQAEKDIIRRWVAEGAVYEGHWAFQPVKRPPVPELADHSRLRNPIDHFVQDRLRREDLTPSNAADNRSLLRWVSLYLTGLLPSLVVIRVLL